MYRIPLPTFGMLAAILALIGCASHPLADSKASTAPLVLSTATVNILGANARVASTPSEEYLGYWTDTDTVALWSVKTPNPGAYKVELLYSLDTPYAGSIVVVSAAGQTLTSRLTATRNWDDYQRLDLGTFTIAKPGDLTLTVKPVFKPRQYVMNLQQVILSPVR